MKFHYNTVDHILKTNNLEFFKFSTVKFYDSLTLREEIACYIEASANNYIKDNEW